jgi:hypothetical protein
VQQHDLLLHSRVGGESALSRRKPLLPQQVVFAPIRGRRNGVWLKN